MKQIFNFNINQILATYMYAKVKCLDLLSVATTREEIRFVADEFAKHLQNQEIHISESTSVMEKNLNKTKTLSNIKEIIH